MKDVKNAIKIIGVTLTVAAVVHEMRKPVGQRTWRGRLNFTVPYDFTLPTVERLREAYWNPIDDRVLTERVLGVGWAVNFNALLKRVGLL